MEETIRMPLRFELWGKRITEHREREMLRETLCLSVWDREQEIERERLSCCLASFRCLGSISMQLYLYNKSPSFRLSSLFSVHCNYKRKGRNSMGPAKLSYFHHTGESRIFSNYFSLGLPYFKLAQPLGAECDSNPVFSGHWHLPLSNYKFFRPQTMLLRLNWVFYSSPKVLAL